MSPRRAGAILALASVLASGCPGGPKEKAVYPVRGRLTFEGKPMAKAVIAFHSADEKDRATAAHGTADDDGRYALYTYRPGDGAPAGDHVVTVYWPAPRPKAGKAVTGDAEDAGAMPTVDKLDGRYATAGASKLRAKVEPKDNEINFTLP